MGDFREEMQKAAEKLNIPIKKEAPRKTSGSHKEQKTKKPMSNQRDTKMPKRVLPLYDDLKRNGTEQRPMDKTANTGLIFDKFCDHWSGDPKWKADDPLKNEKAVKQQFLDAIVNHLNDNKGSTINLLSQYHSRRDRLVESLHGASCNFTTTWRFVSGLGMGHVLETGFVWHRILGVPYLPGSSVKGLTRAWAEQWGGAKHDEVIRLFGPRNEEAQKNPSVGNLIVFDAIPVNTPDLEVDIMNPHYAPYYEDKKGETPPADYHSPRPIFFLTVKEGVQFKFSIAPRPGGDTKDDDVELGFELLKCALENIGTGAKTAVGYGYFK